MTEAAPIGLRLREWRQRRRLSQLDLALEADISTKHVSFLETGRAAPSRDMLLHLCERLEVPLRDRNALLVSAGFAPVFPERDLSDQALAPIRQAIDKVLSGHEPYPALAIDRHWNMVAANRMVPPLMAGADPSLLTGPINVLRLSLHPQGLAGRIVNYAEWRAHLLARLKHQIDMSADDTLADLYTELAAYPAPSGGSMRRMPTERDAMQLAVPLEFTTDAGLLRFFSTTMMFGTPVDITLSELAIEAFFPADAATAEILRTMTP
ncbi:helix-turn-helix domain-containing protein [Ferrovibrio sp.]|uniref:MmyB family transcriptional regulator n=1 Tax=Ferrovibrio sp. TaxID=1917215 RepID=UPI003D0D8D02